MKINIEVSGRHVHLSREHVDILFGKGYELTVNRNLSQPGQYACKERVNIIGSKGEIKNVAVLGPCRKNTQIEISLTDSIKLGVKGVIRESGDLKGSAGCKIQGPVGEVELKEGVIVAKRHIHMNPKDADSYGLEDGMICKVKIVNGCRGVVLDDVVLRVNKNFSLVMHVDTDEANAFNYVSGTTGELIR